MFSNNLYVQLLALLIIILMVTLERKLWEKSGEQDREKNPWYEFALNNLQC